MADIARLNVLIEAKAEQLEKELQSASQKIDRFGARMQSIGARLTAGVTLPIAAIGTAAVRAANQAEESENLFEVSMGRMAQAARSFSEETADALGRNAFAIRENIGSFNALFSTLGLAEQSAFEMSTALAKLTIDLSSFFNTSEDEAFRRLQSGLSGQVEPLRRFNVFLNEATLAQVAYANGIAQAGAELTEAQKVQARYLAIVEQTSLAQGDAERTADSLTNQLRSFSERVKEATINIGRELQPAIRSLVAFGNRLLSFVEAAVERFAQLPAGIQAASLAFVAFAAAAGPVLIVLGSIAQVIASVALAASTAAGAAAIGGLAALFATGGPLVLGIAAAATGLGLVVAKLTESSREARRAKDELDRFRESLGRPVTAELVRDFNVEASLAAIEVAILRDEIRAAIAAGNATQEFALTQRLKEVEAAAERARFQAEQINQLDIETEATIRAEIKVKERELTEALRLKRQLEEGPVEVDVEARFPTVFPQLGIKSAADRAERDLENVEDRAVQLNNEILSLRQRLASFTDSAGASVVTASVPIDGLTEALARVTSELNLLESRRDVFSLDSVEVAEERVRILESALNDLLRLDLSPQSAIVQEYAAQWAAARDNLQQALAARERIGALDFGQGALIVPNRLPTDTTAGILDFGQGVVDAPAKRTEQALKQAEIVGRSFEAGFQQLGANLIRAIAGGMESASDLLLQTFTTIIGSLLNFGIGKAIGGIFSVESPVGGGGAFGQGVGSLDSVAPLSVTVDLSGAVLFGDPAAVARTPGAQVFVREANLTARESGF